MGKRVRVDIDSDASGVKRGTREAETALGRLNKVGSTAMTHLKTAALGAGFAVGGALVTGIIRGTQELIAQEKASGRTANVLATTGHAANVTAKQVEDLASSIQDATGSQDDMIQSGANVLLTFTKVRNEVGKGNDVFNRATEAANDMSVAMGKEMPMTAKALGRALEDPVKGLGALSKAGVVFTAQQKEQIAAMVESGNQLGAQKLILEQVEKRFKGAASSEGEITEATQRMSRQFEDASEALAGKVLPSLIQLMNFVDRNSEAIGNLAKVAAAAAAGWIAYEVALKAVAVAQKIATVQAKGLMAAMSLNPIGLAVAAIAALAAAVFIFRSKTNAATDSLNRLTKANEETAQAARDAASALDAEAAAVDSLKEANIRVEESELNLKDAKRAVNDALREGGKGTDEYKRALLNLRRAEVDVSTATRSRNTQARETIKTTKETNAAIEKSITTAKENAKAADKAALGVRTGIIAGKDAAKVMAQQRQAQKALTDATSGGEAKYRAAAGKARELAGAIKSNTPNARALREELIRLSNVDVSLADAIAAMNNLASAAGGALSAVNNLYAKLASGAPEWTAPSPGGGGGGGGGKPKGSDAYKPAKSADDYDSNGRKGGGFVARRGELSPTTISDRSSSTIDARHRDDSLQDKQARNRAATEAGKAGVTNPDEIAARQDREVLVVRKRELDADVATVNAAVLKVEARIRTLRAKLAGQRARKRKAKKADQPKLQEGIDATRGAIRSLWDEHRALRREWADLKADSRELQHDIAELNTQIESMPDVIPPESDDGVGTDGGEAGAATGPGEASQPSEPSSGSDDPNTQAMLDQANRRAEAAISERNASDAFLRAVTGGGYGSSPAGLPPVTINVEGSLVTQGDLPGFLVQALSLSPYTRRVAYPSGA